MPPTGSPWRRAHRREGERNSAPSQCLVSQMFQPWTSHSLAHRQLAPEKGLQASRVMWKACRRASWLRSSCSEPRASTRTCTITPAAWFHRRQQETLNPKSQASGRGLRLLCFTCLLSSPNFTKVQNQKSEHIGARGNRLSDGNASCATDRSAGAGMPTIPHQQAKAHIGHSRPVHCKMEAPVAGPTVHRPSRGRWLWKSGTAHGSGRRSSRPRLRLGGSGAPARSGPSRGVMWKASKWNSPTSSLRKCWPFVSIYTHV